MNNVVDKAKEAIDDSDAHRMELKSAAVCSISCVSFLLYLCSPSVKCLCLMILFNCGNWDSSQAETMVLISQMRVDVDKLMWISVDWLGHFV